MPGDHPVFTRVYGAVAEVGERTGLGRVRARLLSRARGRLLVVGLGPGHDLDHLPAAVTSVVALEPSDSMRRAAEPRVRALIDRGMDIDLMAAPAERTPLPDASVDTALAAYVLCSVTDPRAALAEIRRVLRPGGELLLLEHVAERPGSLGRGVQRALGRVWPRMAGGCRLDRDTLSVVRSSGFDVSELKVVRLASLPPVSLTLVGHARRPG